MEAEDQLRALAKASGWRTRRCEYYDPNHREVQIREVKGTLRYHRIRIGASKNRLAFEVRGFETSVAFAFGARDRISRMDRAIQPGDTFGNLRIFISKLLGEVEVLNKWLNRTRNRQALLALGCSQREPLFVYRNVVTLHLTPDRAMTLLLSKLIDVVELLPRVEIQLKPEEFLVDGLVLSPDLLPDDLRPLVPFIKRWALGDDGEREERLSKTTPTQLAKFLRDVGPLKGRIDQYLDSFASNQLPDNAILLGNLAQAVAEIRLRGKTG